MSEPIDVYYWPTPNGHKITMFLEEAGLAYRLHPINIGKGDQFGADFLKISPNNKIPAIVDPSPPDGGPPLAMFESAAILIYLAEKTGRFMATELRSRAETLTWLFWQMSGLGPMSGQSNHFTNYAAEKIPYAIERYQKETSRLYAVLDHRLAGREFIVGDYGIADMACYPWITSWERLGQKLDDFPELQRWFLAIKSRPATQRAWAKGKEISSGLTMTDEVRKVLFGQDASVVKRS